MGGKPTKRAEARERAKLARSLDLTGMSNQKIAMFLGISRSTVVRYLRRARRMELEEVMGLNQENCLAERVSVLTMIRTKALQDAELAPSASKARATFLRLAKDVERDLTQILRDAGMLGKLPPEVSLEEGNPFSDSEFRQKFADLMIEARKKGIKISGL